MKSIRVSWSMSAGIALWIALASAVQAQTEPANLLEARKGFKTKIINENKANIPLDFPPRGMFNIVKYPSPAGQLSAYLAPDPKDGKKHPAIIWLTGGFDNSIGMTAWAMAPEENDQSARAFREAGIIMMYPSLRGGNKNPGVIEAFYGEVDDVLAAAEFLSKQTWVDPKRIYLGGHSTGGTLALLVAESTNRFRTVFSFGPVAAVGAYGREQLPFDLTNEKELALRAPIAWLQYIKTPVHVFEGKSGETNNSESIQKMVEVSKNELVEFHLLPGADHFSILAPVTTLIAKRITDDKGEKTNISFTQSELEALFAEPKK